MIPRSSRPLQLMLQTHYKLRHEINVWGCYFRSLVAIAESWTGKRLGSRRINLLYEMAIEGPDPMMSDNCKCYPRGAGGGITNLAFRTIGVDRHARQFGSRIRDENGRVKVAYFGYDEPPEEPPTIHYSILWGHTEDEDHYRLADENGREIFNPDPFAVVVSEVSQLLYEVT